MDQFGAVRIMKIGDLISFIENVPVSITFLGRKKSGTFKVGTKARVMNVKNDVVEIMPTGIMFNITYDVPIKSVKVISNE